MRPVYVQTQPDGRFLNANGYVASEGFRAFGYDVRTFVSGEVEALLLSPKSVVVGHIGTLWRALEELGRGEWATTLGEVRRLGRVPVFVKPLERGKAFSGHVVGAFRDLIETAAFPDDLPLLAQAVVAFNSEWRAFVLWSGVLGVGHYRGDPLRFPDAPEIRAMLDAYDAPPAGYALDVGVTGNGRTLLVELNDGYALGSYGLPPVEYARLLEARWDELCAHRVGSA